MSVLLIFGGIGICALFFFIGIYVNQKLSEAKLLSSEKLAQKIIQEAQKEAENYKKSASIAVKEEWYEEKLKFEKETVGKRKDLERQDKRLLEKEVALDRRHTTLNDKERELMNKEKNLMAREKIIKVKAERLDQLIRQENEQLEKIAMVSPQDAKNELLKNLEAEVRNDAASLIKELKDRAREEGSKYATEIIIQAVQRCATAQVVDSTISVVSLPSDDMKGRIIGREGRNIRTFENLTGVEVIIDDTPGAVSLSSFDPIRREIARISMERLIADSRIHPARIEEVVNKVKDEMDEIIKAAGEEAVLELGIIGLNSDLVHHIGRMKYRTSYGQNLLQHAKEVAYLTGLMAQELDLDVATAKRAGLLHDLGKVANINMEGPHAKLGGEIAMRHGESETVVNAIEAHHEEVPASSCYAVLVEAADAISGSRPGARRESIEAYIKRLENLEAIANSFEGVDKTFAIQAGREIRVMVEPERVTDFQAQEMAGAIAKKVEQELQYPGQIKVTVIRETRAVEFAK